MNRINFAATICFGLAILHTFLVNMFIRHSYRYPENSVGRNFWHLLGEMEITFGLWSAVFLVFMSIDSGLSTAIKFLNRQDFREPAFIFTVMAVCSTQPILRACKYFIECLARGIPLAPPLAIYFVTLTVGPLLGSLITEPAAMTIVALLLYERFFTRNLSNGFRYATVGLLFVNVSIGGTLSHFAAPPVLMVAPLWGWNSLYMLTHFGWKAATAIFISTALVSFRFRKVIAQVDMTSGSAPSPNAAPPIWVTTLHLATLFALIFTAHHLVVFVGIFLFFLGMSGITRKFQTEINLRPPLLVAFFLAGLVILGGEQKWWLAPLLTNLQALPLYIGAICLTSITDNAGLTYLGAQVPNLSDSLRFALLAGAVVGGGLTVVANAPNPAGYQILSQAFGKDGIKAFALFKAALPPTAVAALCLWLL